MVTQGKVRIGRSGRQVRFRICQSFGPAENPVEIGSGVTYAGFVQKSSLEILDPPGRVRDRIGLWHLLQVPHAGELQIPTLGRARPTLLFCGPSRLPAGAIRVCRGRLIHRTVPQREYKMGLSPSQVLGRIGYLFRKDRKWNLVVWEFQVDPRRVYVDVPWRRPRAKGAAVQFCGVDSPTLGKFAELEYHGSAVGHGTGRNKTEEISNTWAFRGNPKAIRKIMHSLLSVYAREEGIKKRRSPRLASK